MTIARLIRFPMVMVGTFALIGCTFICTLIGCKDLTGRQPLPAGTPDPSTYNTPAGALSMRNTAIVAVQNAIPAYITASGLLSDELESNQFDASLGTSANLPLPLGGAVDERILPELTSDNDLYLISADYNNLQAVRGDANQAIGALTTYDLAAPPALRGELYALEGYAEILLAEFYCSGVPLSTVDFQQDFTYHPGSSTAQVSHDAIAKEDSALVLSGDSARILNLARVLKGRAYLDLGQYDSAAAAVQLVPDNFQYQLAIELSVPGTDNTLLSNGTVSDHEGGTGLPYVSGNDPRTATIIVPTEISGTLTLAPLHYPARYATIGFTPFPVADWIEARLIRAEAALQSKDYQSWLGQLNTLRQTATIPGQTGPLSTLSDPGASPQDSARVALLFQERAYWLFITGHRQGDLRRLIRQYGRTQGQVYPTGPYLAPGAGQYGSDVTAPIPSGEYTNKLFHGCLNRGA